MTTLVGKDTKFVHAMKDLLELEFDALGAYNTLIDRLKNEIYKNQVETFKKDHEWHINALKKVLEVHDVSAPKGPDSKQWLTKGKVVLANIIGEGPMLLAMASNEEDMVEAYQRMVERTDKWEDAEEVLERGLSDEKRHLTWMKTTASESS